MEKEKKDFFFLPYFFKDSDFSNDSNFWFLYFKNQFSGNPQFASGIFTSTRFPFRTSLSVT